MTASNTVDKHDTDSGPVDVRISITQADAPAPAKPAGSAFASGFNFGGQ